MRVCGEARELRVSEAERCEARRSYAGAVVRAAYLGLTLKHADVGAGVLSEAKARRRTRGTETEASVEGGYHLVVKLTVRL